jgi:hypothetical protein
MKWHNWIVAIMLSSAHAATTSGQSVERPDWVERENWAKPPVRYRVVSSELWAKPEEALADALQQATNVARDFVIRTESGIGSDWGASSRLVQDRLVREEFVEKVDWSYGPELGPVYRAYMLLELSPENRDLLVREWDQSIRQRRLGQIGGGFGFVVVCLLTVLGFLRLDDATRGYYTPWLMTGAGALVAGTGAALYTLLV